MDRRDKAMERLKEREKLDQEWVGLTDEQMLGNLLARIHRDGGHYQGTHGVKKACEDAEAKVVGWLSMEHEIESTKEKNT